MCLLGLRLGWKADEPFSHALQFVFADFLLQSHDFPASTADKGFVSSHLYSVQDPDVGVGVVLLFIQSLY